LKKEHIEDNEDDVITDSDLNLEVLDKDYVVQSPISTETLLNNEHMLLYFDPEKQEGNEINPYVLVVKGLDTVPAIVGEQRDLVTVICKDHEHNSRNNFLNSGCTKILEKVRKKISTTTPMSSALSR
jgi:hypothetical protein